jgi:hypothetical protein
MSTSGTYTFALNRDQLITSALRKVSAFESGETPDAAAVDEASDALNTMIKHWQGAGVEIWTTEEAVLFPVTGQTSYVLGLTSADRAAGPYVQTALTSDAAISATSIVVDSVTNIATTYIIGIVLDDGTIQWTTVNGAPSGSTVTITAALTDSASEGNAVFVYPAALVRPLKILAARRHNLDSGIDVPLSEMGRVEYQDMPNKATESAINSYYYDRRGGAETNGLIYLWPTPADETEVVKLTVALPIQDFTAAGNDADFPPEWTRAIVWGLADELADEYDVPEPKRTRIERRAAQYLAEANWWERELLEFQFVPDTSR